MLWSAGTYLIISFILMEVELVECGDLFTDLCGEDCAEDSINEIFQKERAHEASAILRKVKVR